MDMMFVLYLGRRTLETALLLAGPALLVGMIVGVTVTLLQAVTSIRDMTLTIVPKILAMAVTILLLSGWMLQVAIAFTTEIFDHMQNLGR